MSSKSNLKDKLNIDAAIKFDAEKLLFLLKSINGAFLRLSWLYRINIFKTCSYDDDFSDRSIPLPWWICPGRPRPHLPNNYYRTRQHYRVTRTTSPGTNYVTNTVFLFSFPVQKWSPLWRSVEPLPFPINYLVTSF